MSLGLRVWHALVDGLNSNRTLGKSWHHESSESDFRIKSLPQRRKGRQGTRKWMNVPKKPRHSCRDSGWKVVEKFFARPTTRILLHHKCVVPPHNSYHLSGPSLASAVGYRRSLIDDISLSSNASCGNRDGHRNAITLSAFQEAPPASGPLASSIVQENPAHHGPAHDCLTPTHPYLCAGSRKSPRVESLPPARFH